MPAYCAPRGIEPQQGNGGAPGRAQGIVDDAKRIRGCDAIDAGEGTHGGGGSGGGDRTVAQPVGDQDRETAIFGAHAEGVAAIFLAGHGYTHAAPGKTSRRPIAPPGLADADPADDCRAALRPGRDVEDVRLAAQRAQPLAGAAGGRMAVAEGFFEAVDAAAAVDTDHLHPGAGVVVIDADQDFAAAGMLELVGGEFGGDDREAAEVILAETGIAPDRGGFAADLSDLLWSATVNRRMNYFQRAIVTRVPSPGLDWMANSLQRRREPLRPRPRPPPVV